MASKFPVEVCKGCKKALFNWESSSENLFKTDDTDFLPFKISWTANTVDPTCAFCNFAAYAAQDEPDYPGKAGDGTNKKPQLSDLIGKTVEFQNESDIQWNWEVVDFNRLRTTAAKTLRWSVYTTAGVNSNTASACLE
jgi:hypothetical protein